MQSGWPEPVERVASFLRAAGAEARLEQLEERAPSARQAAEAIGCALDQIVKSLVLVCDGAPVLALVPGDRRGDAGKIARAAGAGGATIAPPGRVLALTGFEPGAVAPFPLPLVERVLIEHTLLAHAVVWVGGGSEQHLVRLAPTELLRLTRAAVADLVQEPA
ncbi:hypothetical protein Gocc_1094 [Gaiella occulta]|uniref:YbaK/aminoacyl-tRNA synthetase-associated domain-containing protein n=1 Tax=Gaiella occulta TaxID=1002870 RepID=A0A7M2YYW9_9ACTN|nr:YbaK/EbsC family protein [Gaiella occulta]RDI75296.1 hypothetical protein Gocc_1094 [Gaiella occulta]